MDLIIISITLSFLILVSILDLLTRETPYFISFAFILIGFFANLILLTQNFSWFLIINIILAFLISYFKYRLGLWGGGDFLMFLGIVFYLNLAFPFLEFNVFYYLFSLYLATLVYNIIYVLIIYFKHKFFNKYETIFFIFFFLLFFINKFLAIFLLLLWLIVVINKLDLLYFTKKVSINELKEEDWIAYEVYKDDKVVLEPEEFKEGIDEQTIKKLKQLGIKNVYIKDGIPYLPAFLLAYLFLLAFSFFDFSFSEILLTILT